MEYLLNQTITKFGSYTLETDIRLNTLIKKKPFFQIFKNFQLSCKAIPNE